MPPKKKLMAKNAAVPKNKAKKGSWETKSKYRLQRDLTKRNREFAAQARELAACKRDLEFSTRQKKLAQAEWDRYANLMEFSCYFLNHRMQLPRSPSDGCFMKALSSCLDEFAEYHAPCMPRLATGEGYETPRSLLRAFSNRLRALELEGGSKFPTSTIGDVP